MLKFRSKFINGVQHLFSIHGFRQLTLYSTSISTEVNPNFVNYLVQNLGFSKQQALLTSAKFTQKHQTRGIKQFNDLISVENAGLVITFLKKIGLQQSHIRNVVVIEPRILSCKVEKTLIPKIDALRKSGFSEDNIAEIVSFKPSVFFMGLVTHVVPAIQALREIMGCEENLVPMLTRSRYYCFSSITKSMVPNVALLRSYGISLEAIRKLLVKKPYAFVRAPEIFLNSVTRAEEKLGIPRTSARFLLGVELCTSMSEKNIESKMQVYRSFGWNDHDVLALVSSHPYVLTLSEDSIKKRLDLLIKELGYKPTYLASKGCMFTCSFDKRVVPRYKTLSVLKEIGVIEENRLLTALSTAITFTELKFLEKFVLPFKEVHEVYSKHAGISLEKLTLKASKPNLNTV